MGGQKNSNSAQKKKREIFVPYPRTALCTWSNRGTLLTYSYKKYEFNRIEKNQPKDFEQNKVASGESKMEED